MNIMYQSSIRNILYNMNDSEKSKGDIRAVVYRKNESSKSLVE